MGAEEFRYDGKRVLVVGGATGMGAATAALVKDLGAEVVVMDYAEVALPGVKSIHVNLGDKASVEQAIDECGGPIDAWFACAGVADGTPNLIQINFIGHRHMIDRAIAAGILGKGAAIGFISSMAGIGWEEAWGEVNEFLDRTDWESATAWIDAHFGYDNYMWSKQAINGYVAREALAMLKRGIRLNAILPGPTDTPLAQANADLWLTFGADYREELDMPASTPEEQAGPLVFLCSHAARHIAGVTLIVDAGYHASGVTESFPPAKPVVDFLAGRLK